MPAKQQGLVDQHRTVPHTGRSAKQPKRKSGVNRMNKEQQETNGNDGRKNTGRVGGRSHFSKTCVGAPVGLNQKELADVIAAYRIEPLRRQIPSLRLLKAYSGQMPC